jgi:hypothetical protein
MIKPSQHGPLFLLAASLDGDLHQAAVIAGVSGPELAELADALGWRPKLASLVELRETEGPDAFAREVNRLTNYDQATRCRDLLTRAVEHLLDQSPEELLQSVSEKGGRTWTARVFADVAKSMETVQGLTYRALGDTLTERKGENALGAARLAAASRGLGDLAAALDGPTAGRPTPRVVQAQETARRGRPKGKKRKLTKTPVSTAAQVAAALDLPAPEIKKPPAGDVAPGGGLIVVSPFKRPV